MGVPVPGARLIVARLPLAGQSLRITGEEAAHARARRLSAGAAVVLVDGSGAEGFGTVERAAPGSLDVRVDTVAQAPADHFPPIHLLVAAVRAERLAWIAEKATELGTARITVVESERTQSHRASAAPLARLERVVREAAKQSERARWPTLHGPRSFSDAVVGESSAHRLLLDPRGESFPERLGAGSVALLIGPEGGWSEAEHAMALESGWSVASLAAGKLRAETAAVGALMLTRAALARIPH
jgi:16S rRNA (uracil1498-N3)-methyltransferase